MVGWALNIPMKVMMLSSGALVRCTDNTFWYSYSILLYVNVLPVNVNESLSHWSSHW